MFNVLFWVLLFPSSALSAHTLGLWAKKIKPTLSLSLCETLLLFFFFQKNAKPTKLKSSISPIHSFTILSLINCLAC